MRIGFDSINPAAIPADAAVVMGYVAPSHFAWSQSAWNRFGGVKIRITPNAGYPGDVLDVENGDASPQDAPGWTLNFHDGIYPAVVYCNFSTWPAVIHEFSIRGLNQPFYWIAEYPGGGKVLPVMGSIAAIAHQYADSSTSGGDYDLSVIADGFWENTVTNPTNPWDLEVWAHWGVNTPEGQYALKNLGGIVNPDDANDVVVKGVTAGQWLADGMVRLAFMTNLVNSIQLAGTANVSVTLNKVV